MRYEAVFKRKPNDKGSILQFIAEQVVNRFIGKKGDNYYELINLVVYFKALLVAAEMLVPDR